MDPTFQFHIYLISIEGPKMHRQPSKIEQKIALDQT